MLEFIALLAAGIAGLYVVLGLMVYFRQPSYVYVPDRDVDMTPADMNIAYDEVRLQTEDGETIAGWFVPAFGPGEVVGEEGEIVGTTVLMCHGNGGDIGDRIGTVMLFHNWRMNLFIFDYRGYGNSTGRPSEAGTYKDAMAAWKYLAQAKGIPRDHILVYGRSLGGNVAAWLAAEVMPPALVMESAFTSARDMAATMFPFLPVRLVCSFKYDALDALERIRCPVLIAHSRNDEVIPYKHGVRLFEAARKPKRFIELVDGHNDGGLDTDVKYQRALKDFLMQHLGQTGPRD